jgi:hypothetical protein
MTTPPPFRIQYCASITLAIGRSAQNLRELRDHVASVPVESITHHFYESLLSPTFDDPEYRNDFSLWARRHLHDPALGECLAVIDPMRFDDPEALRQQVLDVIEGRLAEISNVPQAAPGHEFHFLRSQLVVLDTGRRAETPEDLAAMLPSLTAGNIYFHFVEARRQHTERIDNFSAWLCAWGDKYVPVRKQLAAIDFYQWSLAEMREQIVGCFTSLSPRGEIS